MKNSFLRNIIKGVVWGVLIPMFLVGCGFEDDLADTGGVGSEEALTYITLNLSAPKGTLSRADAGPTGGETGDGIQKGENYEYLVNSAALFFYQDEKGVNGNANTLVKMVTLGSDSLTNNGAAAWWKYDNKVSSITFSVPSVDYPVGVYHVIVVANPKNLSWATGDLTLGKVRDHIETQAWDEETSTSGTDYSSFLMTSENDKDTLVLSNNDSELNPATLTVEVERMAAQIAYQAKGTSNGTYTISSADGGDAAYEGATVKILGATIVNNLTSGSYLLKRVSSEVTDRNTTPATIDNYLGEEKATNGIATNYVIDPWTVKKDGSTVATTDENDDLTYVINDGNGNYLTYGEYYPGEAVTEAQKVPSYWAALTTTGNTITDDYGDVWHSIGYTMENTMYAAYTSKKYATAMVFQAQFTPAAVTSSLYDKTTLSDGETFFKWNDVLYATAEDMMAAAYPTSDLQFNGEKFYDKITDCTYWSDVKTFAETLRDDDPTGYKAYLLAQVKANENVDDDNEDEIDNDDDNGVELSVGDKTALKWDTYMSETFGYSLTSVEGGGYTVEISDEGVKALYEATDYAVQAFKDGKCYYTWWIRHSNDDDDDSNGVMEYGIVRNNTYYLKVKSVYTLGGYIPMEGLQCDVYVIKWGVLPEETIEM